MTSSQFPLEPKSYGLSPGIVSMTVPLPSASGTHKKCRSTNWAAFVLSLSETGFPFLMRLSISAHTRAYDFARSRSTVNCPLRINRMVETARAYIP